MSTPSKSDVPIEHPPHVHRLLRLIREGTPSHASRASILLGRYAATCCHNGIGNFQGGDTADKIRGRSDEDNSNQEGSSKDNAFERPSIDDSSTTANKSKSFAAGSSNVVVWDLIGRLVGGDGTSGGICSSHRVKKQSASGLFDSNWATRSNSAMALEIVARCLPLADRRNFFECRDFGEWDNRIVMGGNCDDLEPGSSKCKLGNGVNDWMWLDVGDLHKIDDSDGAKSEEAFNTKIPSENETRLAAASRNQLHIVVERGRLLLSSSGERFDRSSSDEEAKEYIREQEALQNLDASAFSPCPIGERSSDRNLLENQQTVAERARQSFLMKRVRLQRNILARRLGLGGILGAPIVTSGTSSSSPTVTNKSAPNLNSKESNLLIDDFVQDEDLIPELSPSSNCNESSIQRFKKRRRVETSATSKIENNDIKERIPDTSIRALLVLESEGSLASPIRKDAHGILSSSAKRSHHRNPQMLLGSELAYRTFDPEWTVRHGALLGTLALLRAWRVHDSFDQIDSKIDCVQQSTNSPTHSDSSRWGQQKCVKPFGRWPNDILARCVCILALDRFADFSGSSVNSDSNASDNDMGDVSIAPVREMAAQIIAILLEAAPRDVWEYAHSLLVQLYARQYHDSNQHHGGGWEIRHGVLLAWKYVCAMVLHKSQQRRINWPSNFKSTHSYYRSTYNEILRQSMTGLGDHSDDNRAIAAQVLLQFLRVDKHVHDIDILKNCSKPLWMSIADIREAVSPCAADLLSLFAELLSIRCSTVISRIGRSTMRGPPNTSQTLTFDPLLRKLSSFLNFDSVHVRISCLRAIASTIETVTNASLEAAKSHCTTGYSAVSKQPIFDIMSALCDLLAKLFQTHFDSEFSSHDCSISNKGNSQKKTGDDSNHIQAAALSTYRDQAWSKILDSLLDVLKFCYENGINISCINEALVNLTLRYFGVARKTNTSKVDEKGPTFMEGKSSTSSHGVVRIQCGLFDEQSAGGNSFSSCLTAARAIAQLFGKVSTTKYFNSNMESSFIAPLIECALQSPWQSQFEAGCLLHTAILSTEAMGILTDNNHPFFLDYLSLLFNAYENAPPCVLLEDSGGRNSVLHDHSVQSLCDNRFAALLDSLVQSLNNKNYKLSKESIQSPWEIFFQDEGVCLTDLRQAANSTVTLAVMRLTALISGSVVSCGCSYLPPKVTPLIRALMTSLKNENSRSRMTETCRYISNLICVLSEKPCHAKARNKLLENLCRLACDRSVVHSDQLMNSTEAAQDVLQLLMTNMGDKHTLQDFSPIVDFLAPLTRNDLKSDDLEQNLSNSAVILCLISKSLPSKAPCLKSVLDLYVKPAIQVACFANSDFTRNHFTTSVVNFCKINFEYTMDLVVSTLLPVLSDLNEDLGRKGGCQIILSVLQELGVSAASHVPILLPMMMRLMTDSLDECSRLAASSFAILVRIAPLAGNYVSENYEQSLRVDSRFKYPSNDVISHLILGKPLPSCELPPAVSSELCENGITLRQYQIEGLSWIVFLSDVHLNGALCDDMGLGKTLQSLVALAISHCSAAAESKGEKSIDTQKKSLVVCPSSVVGHWLSEIKKFFPSGKIFNSLDFTGNSKNRKMCWSEKINECNIIVTSYSVLRSEVDVLTSRVWNYCILDEGHLLKNPRTATAKASRRLKAHHKLILTGTPVQNNVQELWATFDFLMPNFLGSESSFQEEFARPILKSQVPEASAADINDGMDCLKILHQQVLPFVLRREKSQVMKELPPKIITDVPCLLSAQQQMQYQRVLEKSTTKTALDQIDAFVQNSSEDVVKDQPGHIVNDTLSSLLQLRLICTHPVLHELFASKTIKDANKVFSVDTDITVTYNSLECSGKLLVLNDILRHARIAEADITAADNDESAFFVCSKEAAAIDDNENGCGDEDTFGFSNCTDDIGQDQVDESASKCLIFAQFTQSLDVVEKYLFDPHMPSLQYLRLDGRVPSNERNSIAERFNKDSTIKVLLLTTKIGGLGLNLTGADKVIFLEPDWNPFVDLQAMDRAHRIGQSKTVNVYRLITSNTIEETMMKLQQRKKATSDAVVNAENSTMFSMGTDRLLDIFTCRGSALSLSTSDSGDDNVLSYLDDDRCDEYSSLTVGSFMKGLA